MTILPELPANPDKIQKLVALKELLQRIAQEDEKLFNYSRPFHDFPQNTDFLLEIEREAPVLHNCGTPACVAGWALCFLPDEQTCDIDPDKWIDTEYVAAKYLELTDQETQFLFTGDYYRNDDYEELYPDIWSQKYSINTVPIEEAINRIDFLIELNH